MFESIHFNEYQFGITFLILLINIYFIFTKSYTSQKGKNLATKEDIGKITEIVEGLKTRLSFKNQYYLNQKLKERDLLFAFNSSITSLVFYLLRFRLANINLYNYNKLNYITANISKLQKEIDIAESNLEIYYNEKSFYELKSEIIVQTIELQRILDDTIFQITYKYSELDLELNMTSEPNKKELLMKEKYDEIIKISSKFQHNSLEVYKNLRASHISMKQFIFDKMNQLNLEILNEK